MVRRLVGPNVDHRSFGACKKEENIKAKNKNLPNVLAVQFNAHIQTALGCNGVLTSSAGSTLGRGQHGVHESLKSLVHLVVLCLLVAGFDVVHDVVVEDITEDLVSAAEERKEERKQSCGRDHFTVTQQDQRLDHGATKLSIENLIMLGQQGNDLIRELLCLLRVAWRDLWAE